MRRPAAFVLALACTPLAACSGKPTGDALFPLDAGRAWTYRVTTAFENDGTERETLTLRALGSESVSVLAGKAYRRRSDSGADYWLRSDERGVYRVASKSDLDEEPKPDKPERFVLKAPLVVGTQWQAPTTAYLLKRRAEFPPEIRHSHPNIAMQYRIDATDQGVDTTAGHFDKCLRVKGEGTVRVFADPNTGWRDLPLTTLEWYCPGVGLARLERREPANSPFLIGGTLTMELESWQ